MLLAASVILVGVGLVNLNVSSAEVMGWLPERWRTDATERG
jgi:hypothetical protein